ncbi:LLM class flavin-dependent oxidoreductase [Georgenia sp. SUBG003]|uniref:LLM class flavin-dependent oxidoreductase n=1 Tax=Georgenia sp. SUBG003 TaxID=1497974 RepID=UPI003AB19E56
MDYGHPLRLGTFITPSSADPQASVELAVLSENLGYDVVTFQDHPHQPRLLDTWTLLSWVAGRTERIQLAPNVLNVVMRPPAVVARAAASLDLLTDGRVSLALGTGHFREAMESMGADRLTPGGSVGALAEAVDVIRAIWSAGPSPLHLPGEHHRLDGASAGPAPAHDIPVWIGGGRPRMLRLVAAVADGWVVPGGVAGLPALRAGNAVVDDAAARAGRDPREIRRIVNIAGRSPQPPGASSPGRRRSGSRTSCPWCSRTAQARWSSRPTTGRRCAASPATSRRRPAPARPRRRRRRRRLRAGSRRSPRTRARAR